MARFALEGWELGVEKVASCKGIAVRYRVIQRATLMIAVVLVLSGFLIPPKRAAEAGTALADELIVRLDPGIPIRADGRSSHPILGPVLAELGVQEAASLAPGAQTFRLRLAGAISPAAAATRLAATPGIVYAEPNFPLTLLRTPNDPALAEQWPLAAIQAPGAWDVTTGAPVVVAVLDTGVDAGHPDLAGKILPGYNVFSGGADTDDNNGHGTAVAGLIAAATDNGQGLAGLCWGCQILPVKVLTAFGIGNSFSVALGMRWATDNGARVINLSLGGDRESQTLREAVQYALDRGVVIVAASGNERQTDNTPNYPAAYPEVIAVGASGRDDQLTEFSNTGDYLDLVAPGAGGITTVPGGGYASPVGTSFASPWVAGAAGLAISLRPELGWYAISCILRLGADDRGTPGKDPEYGYGRLNVFRALQFAQDYQGCPLDASPPAPAPQPVSELTPGSAPAAFIGVSPPPPDAGTRYFPETGHTLRGEFLRFWQSQNGLSSFGLPISEEFVEQRQDGRTFIVQYFERHRFELHPEQPAPYNVQLSRIGDDVLQASGRDWFGFPRSGSLAGCRYFPESGQSLCEPFLSAWRSSGIELDGRPGKADAENLALFGIPLSPPQVEAVAPGVTLTVQWFERARFEDHGGGRILLGLLGAELAERRGWKQR